MRFAHTTGSVAALLLLTLAPSSAAWAETVPFRVKLESTAHPTAVDSDGDGETALAIVGGGRSNLGPVSQESWIEFLPWDGATFCGPTHVQIAYRFAENSFRFGDGSRIFTSILTGSLCFDFTNGSSVSTARVAVIGGSGRFAGASGTLAFEGTSHDVEFPNGLSPFSAKFEGEITLP
jgi:hypothetical protein